MNRKELIEKVAKSAGINTAQSRRAVEAMLKTMTQQLKDRKKFDLRNFGTLRVEYRKPRRYYSPVTEQFTELRTPVHIGFRAAKRLKKLIK